MKARAKNVIRPMYRHCLIRYSGGDTIAAWLRSESVKINQLMPDDENGRSRQIIEAGLPCLQHVVILHERMKHLLTYELLKDKPSIALASSEELRSAELPYSFNGPSQAGEMTFGQAVYNVRSELSCTNFGTAELHAFFAKRIVLA